MSEDRILFLALSEDVMVHILSFLDPLDLCRLSVSIVSANGYPFGSNPLSSYSVSDLKSRVLKSYLLSKRWRTGLACPRNSYYISGTGTSGISVSDVRFLPGHDDKLFMTVSKSIWSLLSIWSMQGNDAKVVALWSPRGVIVTGFTVNDQVGSESILAISVLLDGVSTVRVLDVDKVSHSLYRFREVYSICTAKNPVALSGDILVLADASTQTVIQNWKNGSHAILRIPADDDSPSRRCNRCLQVLFVHESVLVVRAQAVYLFPKPILVHDEPVVYEPIAQHSFGWVDGISAMICPWLATSSIYSSTLWPPISILVRGESDDPWARDTHHLELNTLFPNPDYYYDETSHAAADANENPEVTHPSPYLFPPQKSYNVKSRRGILRCRQIKLGMYGTAVWLEPRERFSMGLVTGFVSDLNGEQWRWKNQDIVQRNETLRVGVFPGSLSPLTDGILEEIAGSDLVQNEANNWTCLDYDEIGGKIVVASSFGKILVIEL